MLRVLIVEDEPLMQDGLKNMVHWEDYGYEMPMAASNGIEALELMKREKYDLIITDIRMPFLSGIELLKIVHQQYPDIFMIILSGYGEFEYAQNAIKLGASGYLLKPLQKTELVELLQKVKMQYDQRFSSINTLLDIHNRYHGNARNKAEDRFRDIIADSNADTIPLSLLEAFAIYKEDYLLFINIYVDKTTESMDEASYYLALQEIEQHILQISAARLTLLCFSQKMIFVLLSSSSPMNEKLAAAPFVNLAQSESKDGLCVIIATSACHPAEHAIKALQEVRIAGTQRSSATSQHVIYFSKMLTEKSSANTANIVSIVSNISNCILSHDTETLEKIFANLLLEARAHHITRDFSRSFLAPNIFMQIQKALLELKLHLEDIFENPMQDYRKVLNAISTVEMILSLKDYITQVMEFIILSRASNQEILVEQCKQYINENFDNCEFSLEDVAEHISLSKNYLSTLFKKVEGITFSSYLRNIRITKAIQLLRTKQYCVYEVAQMVGYPNVTWFSTNFKKHTGMSPSQFLNQKTDMTP